MKKEQLKTEKKATEPFLLAHFFPGQEPPSEIAEHYRNLDTHVSKKHLPRYINEATFRLNEGDVKNDLMDRVKALCRKMVGVRLSYEELTA